MLFGIAWLSPVSRCVTLCLCDISEVVVFPVVKEFMLHVGVKRTLDGLGKLLEKGGPLHKQTFTTSHHCSLYGIALPRPRNRPHPPAFWRLCSASCVGSMVCAEGSRRPRTLQVVTHISPFGNFSRRWKREEIDQI